MNSNFLTSIKRGSWLIAALVVIVLSGNVFADRDNWKRKEVNLRAGRQGKIKAIYHPEDRSVPTKREVKRQKPVRKKLIRGTRTSIELPPSETEAAPSAGTVYLNSIDSPPIDGFIPWIAVTATNKRLAELELNAEADSNVRGTYLPTDPQSDFAIGLFDTGASSHIIGYATANELNIQDDYLTENEISVSGVTGSVNVWVSQPLGIYIDGLDAVDPNGSTIDLSGMMGESNVAISVGQFPDGIPDLPTAIGSPMSIFYTTTINNGIEITVNRDGETYTGPHIDMFELDDPAIPNYPNIIPLELRPLGGVSVSYIPNTTNIDDIFNLDFSPSTPSIITGNLSQSLFFVHSVDMIDGPFVAMDRDRFMLDTGAQVTVIGSRVAARLGINPAAPEFEVEIEGVTGIVEMMPGFYIDSLMIPALGQWLEVTNVPVILIDIASPEGGTLDGIIGMNLFNECNLVLRGGGLFLQDDPMLEFEFINSQLPGDIAPQGGDSKVDSADLQAMSDAWLSRPGQENWQEQIDIAPQDEPDGIVDLLDFSVLADNWMEGYSF